MQHLQGHGPLRAQILAERSPGIRVRRQAMMHMDSRHASRQTQTQQQMQQADRVTPTRQGNLTRRCAQLPLCQKDSQPFWQRDRQIRRPVP